MAQFTTHRPTFSEVAARLSALMHWQNTVGKIRAQMTATTNAAAALTGSTGAPGPPRQTPGAPVTAVSSSPMGQVSSPGGRGLQDVSGGPGDDGSQGGGSISASIHPQPRQLANDDAASMAAAASSTPSGGGHPSFPQPGSFESSSTLGSSFLGGAEGGGPFSLGSGAVAAANALDTGHGRDGSMAGSVRSVGSIGSLDQAKQAVTARPVYAPVASARANTMMAPSSLPFYPQGAPGLAPGSSRPVYDQSEEMPAMPMPGMEWLFSPTSGQYPWVLLRSILLYPYIQHSSMLHSTLVMSHDPHPTCR